MTTFNFIQDKQSRVKRYGIKCFEIIDGIKFQRFAHAKKSGNFLLVEECYSNLLDINNNAVVGKFKILNIEKGVLANVICIK